MILPMAALAALCAFIGLYPVPALSLVERAAAVVCDVPLDSARLALAGSAMNARRIGLIGFGVIAVGGALALVRLVLLGGRVSLGRTWGCGFTAPTPRMQYTASSFAQPLTGAFELVLGTHMRHQSPVGYWPGQAEFSTHTDDRVLDGFLRPVSSAIVSLLAWAKRRRSRLQHYMLAVALFLLVLLAWKL